MGEGTNLAELDQHCQGKALGAGAEEIKELVLSQDLPLGEKHCTQDVAFPAVTCDPRKAYLFILSKDEIIVW